MSGWLEFWRQLAPKARFGIAAGTVVILVGAGLLAWWLVRPSYGVLYTNIGVRDAAEITAKLQQWDVPFRRGDTGSLSVPAADVLSTRMRLISEGIPNHGTVGFELFDEADYGMTAFAQRINYQRALQGELERTIISLKDVRDARVALSLPRKTLFATQNQTAKGSVTVSLRAGATLSPKQVDGIRRLVASAVRGLSAKNVMVLDDHGNVLTHSGAEAGLGSHLDVKRKYENRLHDKIQKLLVTVFGARNFAVSVDASFDYSKIKNVETRILPAGENGNELILEKKQSETSRSAGNRAGKSDGNGNSQSDIHYLHGKSVRQVAYAPGRLERLSIGVIVPPDMSAKQLTRLREVVAAAAGINPDRGDQITVAAFNLAEPWPTASAIATQPSVAPPPGAALEHHVESNPLQALSLPFWSIAALGACALLLLLTLFAQFQARLRAPQRLTPPARQALLTELGEWLEGPRQEARSHE